MEKEKRPRKPRSKSPPKTPKEDNITFIPDVIEMPVKHILKSKIIWANFIALCCFFFQQKYGFLIPPDMQGELLVLINIILRTLSNSKLTIK